MINDKDKKKKKNISKEEEMYIKMLKNSVPKAPSEPTPILPNRPPDIYKRGGSVRTSVKSVRTSVKIKKK